jgi:hypothetical protein
VDARGHRTRPAASPGYGTAVGDVGHRHVEPDSGVRGLPLQH